MKKIIILAFLTAVLLGVSLVKPTHAQTTKYSFTVTNLSNEGVVIKLVQDKDNPKDYEFSISRFSENEKDLPKGTYLYEYEHCNEIVSGKLRLKNDVEWVIYPCGVQPTKMRINSHFADDIEVTMYGPLELPDPEDEVFDIELGGNRIQDILSGVYVLSYEAACSTVGSDPTTVFSEEIRVRKSGTTQITLHGCEWYASPARTYAKPVPVKFKIVNYASFPLVLQIVGPEGALLDIKPGVNIYELIYGTYKYGYFLDHEYHTGFMMVTKNGLGQLTLKPSHIHELPSTGSENESGG